MLSFADTSFVIPVFDQWLLYAPLHNVTAECSKGFLLALNDNLDTEVPGKLGILMKGLHRQPLSFCEVRSGPLRPEFLGIIPTQQCNLACRYCIFGATENEHVTMEKSMALIAVDWMADIVLSQKRKSLAVDFFGGEPMVAPQIVKAVSQRVHKLAAKYNLEHRMEMATNGYYNEESCQFISENIDYVALSFDGPANVHNLHRPARNNEGSYEVVARSAKILASGPSNLTIRICVTQESIQNLEEYTEWFCREFKPNSLTVEPLRPTTESIQAGLLVPDPWFFAKAVHRATRVASVYGIPLIYASASIDHLQTAFCPMGRDVAIVRPDGTINACYMQPQDWQNIGVDMCFGKLSPVDEQINLDPDAITDIRELSRHSSACRTCFCRWHCAGGCYMNMHSSLRKDGPDDFCIQTRILAVCRLLDRLGNAELADRFAHDRQAQEKLVRRKSDLLCDWYDTEEI